MAQRNGSHAVSLASVRGKQKDSSGITLEDKEFCRSHKIALDKNHQLERSSVTTPQDSLFGEALTSRDSILLNFPDIMEFNKHADDYVSYYGCHVCIGVSRGRSGHVLSACERLEANSRPGIIKHRCVRAVVKNLPLVVR